MWCVYCDLFSPVCLLGFAVCLMKVLFPQDGKYRATGIDYVFLRVCMCTFSLCETFNKLTFSGFLTHLLAFTSQGFDREQKSCIYLKSLSLLDLQAGRCSVLAWIRDTLMMRKHEFFLQNLFFSCIVMVTLNPAIHVLFSRTGEQWCHFGRFNTLFIFKFTSKEHGSSERQWFILLEHVQKTHLFKDFVWLRGQHQTKASLQSCKENDQKINEMEIRGERELFPHNRLGE